MNTKWYTVVTKYYADGRIHAGEEQMTFAQMRKFVGGYIERVPSSITGHALIVNEDGLSGDLPKNNEATKVVRPDILVYDAIRGNALLIKGTL